ncbi:MAG: transposase [Oligoflexia bacterium]|nr:transposase [Oligoflexia bacterium]
MSKTQKMSHKIRILSSKRPVHIVVKTLLQVSLQGFNSIRLLKHLVEEVFRRYGVCVFQYYIQNSHIHLFVNAGRADQISCAMMYLNSKLALYFNKLFSRKGPFWSDRYFSSIKKTAKEIIRAIHYIACQCKFRSPFEDVFSSVGQAPCYPWGIPELILGQIGVGNSNSCLKLVQVIESAILPYESKTSGSGKANKSRSSKVADGQLSLF